MQREICARTDLVDCRTHPKTWDLLRRTRMPAVRIELGYLTNAGDAARLADPAFRDVLAEAVVAAVQRLYLPPDQDAETGFLRIPALRGSPESAVRPAGTPAPGSSSPAAAPARPRRPRATTRRSSGPAAAAGTGGAGARS